MIHVRIAIAGLALLLGFFPAPRTSAQPPEELSPVRNRAIFDQIAVAPALSDLWTPAQLDAAAASGATPLAWAAANIYPNGLGTYTPNTPIAWDRLPVYASKPVQEMLTRPPTPDAGLRALQLHLPAEVSDRFRYQYDAWLSNVVYVLHTQWDALFDLHFMEEVFVQSGSEKFRNGRRLDDRRFILARPLGWDPDLDLDEYRFYFAQTTSINMEVAGRIWTERSRLHWEAVVVNHSAFNWVHPQTIAPGALMCFRSRNNVGPAPRPDFRDPLGERIHYHLRSSVNQPYEELAQSVYDLDGHTSQYFHRWTYSDPYLENRLTKYDKTLARSIEVASSPPRSAHGNRSDGICCVHPNVGWSIPSGQSQQISMEAIFHPWEPTPTAAADWSLYP
jgi:hypothetical protein